MDQHARQYVVYSTAAREYLPKAVEGRLESIVSRDEIIFNIPVMILDSRANNPTRRDATRRDETRRDTET